MHSPACSTLTSWYLLQAAAVSWQMLSYDKPSVPHTRFLELPHAAGSGHLHVAIAEGGTVQ